MLFYRGKGPGCPPLPPFDLTKVQEETAKQLLVQVNARMEAQMRSLDNLRARVMDVARLSTTLTTLVVGALAASPSASVAVQTGGGAAAALWIAAGLVCLTVYTPRPWGLPGWPPHEWATHWSDLEGPSVRLILGLALNRNEDAWENAKVIAGIGRRLKAAIALMVAAPVAGLAAWWVEPLILLG